MRFAEELTALNAKFYETKRRARRHPRAGGGCDGKAWGQRRDGLDARASREYRERLTALGAHSYR